MKFIVFITLVLIHILSSQFILREQAVYPTSPSFPSQEISDSINDWMPENKKTFGFGNAVNKTICAILENDTHTPDIQSVKYISDGRKLNATIWLSKSFQYNPNETAWGSLESTVTFETGKLENQSITLEKFKDERLELITRYPGPVILEENTKAHFGHLPAYKIVYRVDWERNFPNLQVMEIGAIDGDKLYLLEYDATSALYWYYLPQLMEILSSIQIDGTKPISEKILHNFVPYVDSSNNLTVQHPDSWHVINGSTQRVGALHELEKIVTFEPSRLRNVFSARQYAMVMDVHSVFDEGSDYEVAYEWVIGGGHALNWSKLDYEISSTGHFNPIHRTYGLFRNLTHDPYSYRNGTIQNDYVIPFSFDLSNANYPDQYRVNILARDFFFLGDDFCSLVDTTGWVPFPPPHFAISASPGSLQLRPGEEGTIDLTIQSNTTLNSRITLSTESVRGLDLTLHPNETSIIPFGETSSTLHVKDISNGAPRSYPIPLKALFSFPQNTTIVAKNITIAKSKGASVSQTIYLTTTILPPLGPKEYLDSLVDWLSPINSVWTFLVAVGAVVIPYLVRKYSKQNTRNSSIGEDDNSKLSRSKTPGAPF